MVSNAEERFQAICKMKGRRKLRKQYDSFSQASDEAQELFLQVNANRLFSMAPYSLHEFEMLTKLGYRSQSDLGDAIVPPNIILEHNIYSKVVPFIRRSLRPDGVFLGKEIAYALKHLDPKDIESCCASEDCLQALSSYYVK